MISVGAYLRTLRKHQGLSQSKLAELVGVTGNTIWRVESGEQEPKTPLLVAVLVALRGRIEDVHALLSDNDTTAMDGERVALSYLAEQKQLQSVDRETVERQCKIVAILQELLDDPHGAELWIALGERLAAMHESDRDQPAGAGVTHENGSR